HVVDDLVLYVHVLVQLHLLVQLVLDIVDDLLDLHIDDDIILQLVDHLLDLHVDVHIVLQLVDHLHHHVPDLHIHHLLLFVLALRPAIHDDHHVVRPSADVQHLDLGDDHDDAILRCLCRWRRLHRRYVPDGRVPQRSLPRPHGRWPPVRPRQSRASLHGGKPLHGHLRADHVAPPRAAGRPLHYPSGGIRRQELPTLDRAIRPRPAPSGPCHHDAPAVRTRCPRRSGRRSPPHAATGLRRRGLSPSDSGSFFSLTRTVCVYHPVRLRGGSS